MNPAMFKGADLMYGEEQPQFLLLPAHHDAATGVTTVCFEMTEEELEVLKTTRRVWIRWKTGTEKPKPIPPIQVAAESGLP